MAWSDMFDKLDDIIYAPVETICSWAKEPLNRFEAKRQLEFNRQAAELENARYRNEVDVDIYKKECEADIEVRTQERLAALEANQKKWDAEINDLISRQELQRNKDIIQAITEYRHSMIEDMKEINDNLSHMDLEFVKEAHELVISKTEEYRTLQSETQKMCDDQLEEIDKKFANNERIRIRREDMVLAQTEEIINAAKDFISHLKDDIGELTKNHAKRMNSATDFANNLLNRMGQQIEIGEPMIINSGMIDDSNQNLQLSDNSNSVS